jgi:nucleoside-diphosphate-sugar epimerase
VSVEPSAFVAGATGYVGREVVRVMAQERSTATVAHVRPDSSRLAEWRDRVAAAGASVDTTEWDAAAMTETLVRLRPTMVFALLGTTRARGRQAAARGATDTYETVDYALTMLLLDAAAAAARETGVTPRFVYLSSMGVSAGTRNAYLAVRWRVEQALRASGLPFVVARPGFITGPDRDDRRPGERAGAAVTDALLAMAGALGARRLRERYRSTTNTALARALVRLALDPAATAAVVESEALR